MFGAGRRLAWRRHNRQRSDLHRTRHRDPPRRPQTPFEKNCECRGRALPELTPGLPVKKRKGHLAITDRYPGFLHHQVVELGYLKSAHTLSADSIAFNVQPRITGQVLIGSSRQFDTTSEVDNVILGRMLARAVEYMPRLASITN